MEQRTYTIKDHETGKDLVISARVNSKLEKQSKSGMCKALAKRAGALATVAVMMAAGLSGCNSKNDKEIVEESPAQTSVTVPVDEKPKEISDSLRFNPNSSEAIINSAATLIEDAAKAGFEIDAEDAVLSVIVANSDELTNGFMGELFGNHKDQKYTYGKLVDAYIRISVMQTLNIGIAKTDNLAFNMEDIFANKEDYEYLKGIRDLAIKFNNSTDNDEKKKISAELNTLASSLCTHEAFNISSAASVLSMLSLDGMRNVTLSNTDYCVLPGDIRDEMFGNGDYGCNKEGTFIDKNGAVYQAQYSYRVNDLKLDSVKTKLDNAVLEDGKKVILNDIIEAVKSKTKDVKVADIDTFKLINEANEANRNIEYAYEDTTGSIGQGTNNTQTSQSANTNTSSTSDSKKRSNVIYGSKEEAEEALEDKLEDAQAEADRGAADGKRYGENGLDMPSLKGESTIYKNAFKAAYKAYKAIYDAEREVKQEFIPANENKTTEEVISETVEDLNVSRESNSNDFNQNTNSNDSNTFNEDIVVSEEFIPLEDGNEEIIDETIEDLTLEESMNDEIATYGDDTVISEEFISLGDLAIEELLELRQVLLGNDPIISEEVETIKSK